jgi:RimJ/RimL family protein N-acetyltransferase
MSTTDRLTTDRLVLRRWIDDDRAPFAELNADPEVMRYFPNAMTRQESDASVDRIEQSFEKNGFGLWAVEIDGRFAGFTGLNRTTFATPMGPHVEIGWRLATWAWGYGYASEAATRVLAEAFGNLGLTEVYSFTTETNRPSEKVMERIGMTRREDLDFDHPNTPGWWGVRHIVYRAQPMNTAEVPTCITMYQAAHDQRDVMTALAQFANDACVVDDGKTYEGISGVETFLRKAGSEYTYTRTLISAQEMTTERWRVTNRLEGNFPGGQVDLSYVFDLLDGLITRLVIAP